MACHLQARTPPPPDGLVCLRLEPLHDRHEPGLAKEGLAAGRAPGRWQWKGTRRAAAPRPAATGGAPEGGAPEPVAAGGALAGGGGRRPGRRRWEGPQAAACRRRESCAGVDRE